MKNKKERGLWELYRDDPEKADAEIWGRKTDPLSRRGFLKKCGLTTLAAAVGSTIPFYRHMPAGFIPAVFADTTEEFTIPGTNGLVVLNDRPINAETPPHLLDDEFTPNDRHFVRNNGLLSSLAESGDTAEWKLKVDGEVHQPLELNFEQLKQFTSYTYYLQVECGGNGRAGFQPAAKGNQWTFGAIGCSAWTGVRMKDVLGKAGLKNTAIYTGYYGDDRHLSMNPQKVPISRGTPIDKAMEDHTLIAWAMNGKPIPPLHGFPVRVVTPGWPASTSIKWLKRIFVRNKVHDGPKMNGYSYRVPKHPVAPGTHVAEADMKIIESMPVKSLITRPKTGIKIPSGKPLALQGHAWAGDRKVTAMHVSNDFGMTWVQASLKEPANPFAWQQWQATLAFPSTGYYEVWARATDAAGVMQPMVVPGWNPKGYLNNAMHRIAVTVV